MIDLSLRDRIYQVIFGTDTVAGQRFDIVLIYLILVIRVSISAICFSRTSIFSRDRTRTAC